MQLAAHINDTFVMGKTDFRKLANIQADITWQGRIPFNREAKSRVN